MSNKKRSCIFEHSDFVYVCDFATMTMWVVNEEDDEGPVTALEISRVDDDGHWGYRFQGSDAPFTPDPDIELVRKLEKHYEKYLNLMIVGQNARLSPDKTSKIPTQRVRKTSRFHAR